MEAPREVSPPTGAEKTARWAVLAFLGIATLLLAFGFGFFVSDRGKESAAAPSRRVSADENGTSSGGSTSASVGAAVIDEIVDVLKTQYVDRKELDEEALTEAAIAGIIQSLNDRETSYITPADLKAGALNLNSTYQGIGASVSDSTGAIQIVAPFRDSPAEEAGIRTGDLILEVDGEPTDGWTSQQAVDRIRGPKGTVVTLTVKHTDGATEEISVTRGDIDIESVFTEPNLEVIAGESDTRIVDRTGAEAKDIGYLAISQFHEKTIAELKAKAKDMESKGYKGLIVDVRGNPGGGLQATIDVVDEFLNSGTIITEVDSSGKEQSTRAKNGGILTKLPIVVLQDKGSASGAEVLAAALRDNGRATIIGTQSYGKGTVNRLIPLKDCGEANCGALYVAIGRWLTPKGEQIEGLGITPDIELAMTTQEYVDQGDIQLFKAIDVLRGVK
jgi:carboxyl-terminal processing protease